MDSNKVEPKAKRVNCVKPIQNPAGTSIKIRKYTTRSSTTLTKQPTTVDVNDFDLDLNYEISNPTLKKRAQQIVNPYIPHSDFNSAVKLSANKNVSFSYRTAAKQLYSQNISKINERIFDELKNNSKDDQQISKNEELVDTKENENISIEESEDLKTSKTNLKGKRFKKYSPSKWYVLENL